MHASQEGQARSGLPLKQHDDERKRLGKRARAAHRPREPLQPSRGFDEPWLHQSADEVIEEVLAATAETLPTLRGIVNQKIRDVSDDEAACRLASNLDVPKEREKKKEARKADDA